jgi:superoxide oxidase
MMNEADPTPNGEHPARARHQSLTIALHWSTVLLVLTQFTFAILHDQVSNAEVRRDLLTAHRSLGIVIWLVVLGRIAWRFFGMRLLPFPASMARWHQWGARFSEWGLYGLLLAQPLTGMAATVLGGRPFNLFGIQLPSLITPDKEWAASAHALHTLGAYVLASLVFAHASAAILHRVIANDGVLDSMLPISHKRSGAVSATSPAGLSSAPQRSRGSNEGP